MDVAIVSPALAALANKCRANLDHRTSSKSVHYLRFLAWGDSAERLIDLASAIREYEYHPSSRPFAFIPYGSGYCTGGEVFVSRNALESFWLSKVDIPLIQTYKPTEYMPSLVRVGERWRPFVEEINNFEKTKKIPDALLFAKMVLDHQLDTTRVELIQEPLVSYVLVHDEYIQPRVLGADYAGLTFVQNGKVYETC